MSFNSAQTLRSAEKHLSRGKINAAIEEYRKLVNWDPTDLSMLNTLGDLYARAGLNDQATRIFSRVAKGYSHQGFTSKAIALLKKLLRIDPTDLDSAAQLAECYLAQGLRGEAGRQYGDIADAYKRAGRDDKALDAYQRMVEIDPSNTSLLMILGERWQIDGLKHRAHTSFVAAGDEFSKQGNDERALAAYLKAQGAQPDEHKTLAAIASICTARGQEDSAIPVLRESLSRNSGDAELHRILGSTYLSAGLLDDADRTFRKLLELDEREYRNLLIVAERFLESGDLDRAVEQIDGMLDLLIANRNEQAAVSFMRKVLDQDAEHLAALKTLAHIFRRVREDFNLAPTLKALAERALRRGDRDDAIESLTELCSLEPDERAHCDALRKLGVDIPVIPYTICSAGDSQWEYVKSEGGAQRSVLGTAEALFRSGQVEDSTALLRRALRNQPDNLEVRLALKEIYASAGFVDQAASESVQISRIHQGASHLDAAERQFVRVDEIRGMTPLPEPSVSSEPDAELELVTPVDRRQLARVLIRVPIVVISEIGGWREFTQTVDISETGLKVRLVHNVAPTTALGFSLEMTKWPEAVERMRVMNSTRALVRYCTRWPGEPNVVGFDLSHQAE